jgi:hypothetical protein
VVSFNGAKPEHAEPILEGLEVLLDAKLHDLRPMANGAEVVVDPADHLLTAMTELPAHRVQADRRTSVERLQPRSCKGVAKDAGAKFSHLLARPSSDPIDQLAHIDQHRR